MNSLSRITFTLAAALLAPACASSSTMRVPVAAMAAREAQTRSFEHVGSTAAMKAALDMLQDGGFTIDRTDAALGLVVGTRSVTKKASGSEKALKWTMIAFSYGAAALLPWTKHETSQIEAAVNVTPVGDDVRVRITLQCRVLDGRGQLKRIEPVTEPALYADMFELLGRSVFIAAAQADQSL